MNNIKATLKIFEEACIRHNEATESGDYKKGNKEYDIIINAYNILKSENSIYDLKEYLSSPFIGVRLWTAYYWLPINELEALAVLNEIEMSPGIISLTAETIISEWNKGNLKF